MISLSSSNIGTPTRILTWRKTYLQPKEMWQYILRIFDSTTKSILNKFVYTQSIRHTLFTVSLLVTEIICHVTKPWPATIHIILITLSPWKVSICSFDFECVEMCSSFLPFEITENAVSKGWVFSGNNHYIIHTSPTNLQYLLFWFW